MHGHRGFAIFHQGCDTWIHPRVSRGPMSNAAIPMNATVRNHVANIFEHAVAFLRGAVELLGGTDIHTVAHFDFMISPLT